MTATLSETAHRHRLLWAVSLAATTLPMAFTGPAVALGAIADDLHAGASALPWITNAFMLAFGGCLLPAGALADRLGRRRVFLVGAALFLAASLLLALATDIRVFNALRALQGVASAALMSAGAAALAQGFDGEARTRAFSWLGTSFGAGLVLGPLTAGVLSQAFGWRAIFALLILTMGVAGGLALRALRESRAPAAERFDWAGAVVFIAALSVLTLAALSAAAHGWGDARVGAGGLLAALLFAAFVRIERRSATPMLDLSLFRYRRFLGIQLLAAAPAYGFVVLLVLLPLRFNGIEGQPAGTTGWLMAALSAPLLVLPLAAGRATRWWSPAALCSAGLLAAAAGLLWLARARGGVDAVPAMLLIGAGISLPWGLMDGLAVSVVPPERAGMAAGIFSTTRVAGEGIALAIVGSVLTARVHAQLPAGDASQTVAQLLGSGRLAEALRLDAGLDAARLVLGYEAAFAQLLLALAAVTVATALVLLALLAPRRAGVGMPSGGGCRP